MKYSAVNVRAPFLFSKLYPGLRSSHGRIINLGSVGGEKPWPPTPITVRPDSVSHAHSSNGQGARTRDAVNCVAPGMIDAGPGEKDPGLLQRVSAHNANEKEMEFLMTS